jgi:hypothetical protein
VRAPFAAFGVQHEHDVLFVVHDDFLEIRHRHGHHGAVAFRPVAVLLRHAPHLLGCLFAFLPRGPVFGVDRARRLDGFFRHFFRVTGVFQLAAEEVRAVLRERVPVDRQLLGERHLQAVAGVEADRRQALPANEQE